MVNVSARPSRNEPAAPGSRTTEPLGEGRERLSLDCISPAYGAKFIASGNRKNPDRL